MQSSRRNRYSFSVSKHVVEIQVYLAIKPTYSKPVFKTRHNLFRTFRLDMAIVLSQWRSNKVVGLDE